MATKRNSSVSSNTTESVVTIDLQPLLTPLAILISGILISLSIFLAGRSIAGEGLFDKPGNTPTVTPTPADSGDTNTIVTTSIDNDPILGNKNAKIAIVEYSDYECPYCQRHFTEVHSKIVENYVNKGDVMLVFRDFPLTSIHPNAMKYAIAAECFNEQASSKYFEVHDAIFTQAASGVLSTDALVKIGEGLGANGNNMKSCIESSKYEDEVNGDISDGSAAGVSGTPTFVIGEIDGDGNVTGVRIVGAQPYSVFEAEINKALGK